jgi:hypothetical protein
MNQRTQDRNEREVVNFVPDEVCMVVRVDNVEDGAALYAHVRDRVNARVAELLRLAEKDRPVQPLAQDLFPRVLARRFGANATSILQPLRRPGIAAPRSAKAPTRASSTAPAVTPWLPLRRERSGASTWHLTYQLGRDRLSLDSRYLEQRRLALESVRELTLLLNQRLPGETIAQFRNQPWSVSSVAPNWLTAAAPFSCGSPAGVPIPARPKTPPHVDFPDPRLQSALRRRRRGDVVIAVLDTCPTQQAVDDAASAFQSNTLLRDVRDAVTMNEPALIPDGYFDHLLPCLPRVQWDMHSGPAQQHPESFQIPDHGLFATGLIRDIVGKQFELHLVRVLNEYGIGDSLAINHALAALPAALGISGPGPEAPRLVVNLSLGYEVPIPARLLDRWLPTIARDPEQVRSHLPEICTLLDQIHGNLSDVMTWLAERGVLVVAAAGNDALRRDVAPGAPPPPRFPARYDDVLGVAAMRRDLRNPANYSNRGDTVVQVGSGHIATFGGNVKAAPQDDASHTPEPNDSVVGIFSGPLPNSAVNASGWAKWSGTSFATPIIAGIAARLWASEPALTPQQIAGALRGFAQHPHGGVNPDSPLEVPVLPVTQT